MSEAGRVERDFWERRAAAWERRMDALDLFSDAYGTPAMDALAAQPGERIVDIGCGPGTTAIGLAQRVGPDGEVIALDISEAMIAAAQRRAERAGVTNIRFLVGDLEREPIEDGGLDGAFSRFGVMFFTDPVAAFSNVARSLRPSGRLACTVWGPLGDNPWMFVPTLAAAPALQAELALPGPDEPGPFLLAEPERFISILERAGFVDVDVSSVTGARVVTEADADEEVRALLEVGPMGEAYDAADEPARQEAVDAVISAIEPYREEGGWRLAGSAHVVTAARPAG
ncbi:MAG: methyltransferase domain-containing protein [Acidimicrobiales bacterium]